LYVTKESINIENEGLYESEEGFSRPDSDYIEPQVIDTDKILRDNSQSYQNKQTGIYGDSYSASLKGLYQGLDTIKHQERIKNKQLSKKSILGIFLALLIIAVPLIFINIIGKEQEFSFIPRDAIEIYVNHNESEAFVFNTKGDMLNKVEKVVYPIYSPDHTAAVLLAMNGTISYYVNANQLIELQNSLNNCIISEDGKYLLYSTSNAMNKFSLYLYEVEKQNKKLIDEYDNRRFEMLNVSSGGKTITYVTYNYSDDSKIIDVESYISKNGEKPELMGKDIIIFAISKDDKNRYTFDYKDGTPTMLKVAKEGESINLSSKLLNMVNFNRDYSEIMFNEGEATYISSKGNERQKVADSLVDKILIPKKGISNLRTNSSIMLYSIKSFQNKVILCKDKTLVFIGDNYESTKIGITQDVPLTAIAKGGNDLFYIDSNRRLIKVSDLSGKCNQQSLADKVDSFATSDDFSQLYYISGNRLYYKKQEEKAIMINDNASNIYINQDGDTAFFLQNYTAGSGTLLYSIAGSKPEPVADGDGVSSIQEWNYGIIYQKFFNGTNTVFYNSKGKEFTFLMDGSYIAN
jgi:hypothetical protein